MRQLDLSHNRLVNKLPWDKQQQFEWEDEAKQISAELQVKELIQQASELTNLCSLKLMLTEHCNDIAITAKTIKLASVWHQICMLSQLQSLTVVDHKVSEQLADGLCMLSELTTLTSSHLQRGYPCLPQYNPSGFNPALSAEFGDLCETLRQLQLLHLTLAFMHFNTDLSTFWELIAQSNLTYLKLEYITFDNFNYFDRRSAPAEMPAITANLVNLR